MTMWKVWKTGSEVFYYLEKKSADEALEEVRKDEPDADSIQACTQEEADEIKGKTKQEELYRTEARGFLFLFRRMWGDERGDRWDCHVARKETPNDMRGFAWMPIKADWRDFVLWCLENFPYENAAMEVTA